MTTLWLDELAAGRERVGGLETTATGITVSLDVGSNGCGEGVPGLGKTMIYGKACALIGEPTDLCVP